MPDNCVNSRITGGSTEELFTATVLTNHRVKYYRCNETGFIQTEQPYWLDEAYSDAITALDIGLLSRNIQKVEVAQRVLRVIAEPTSRFLDFGGGYGIFVRLMRDRGYPFELFDTHCQPLFAKHHRLANLDFDCDHFGCVTAWEVFEHLVDPSRTIAELLQISDRLLFSTVLVPEPCPASAKDWWYFTPETGQHISFFTLQSLQWIADQLGIRLYSDGVANHLFSKEELSVNPLATAKWRSHVKRVMGRLSRSFGVSAEHEAYRDSLLQGDYDAILRSLRNSVRDDESDREP